MPATASTPTKGSSGFTAVATDRLWTDRVAREETYQRIFAYDAFGHTATAQPLVSSGSIITKSASQVPFSVYSNEHNNPANSPLAAKRREKLGVSTTKLPTLSPERLGEVGRVGGFTNDVSPVSVEEGSDRMSPLTTDRTPTQQQRLNTLPPLGELTSLHPWAGSLSASTSPRRPYTERGLLDEQMAKRVAVSSGKKGYGSSFLMRSVTQDSFGVRSPVELKDVSAFGRRKYAF